MKTIIFLFNLIFLFSATLTSQTNNSLFDSPRNTIAVTPKIDFIGDSGYIVYYKRLLKKESNQSNYIRLGIDLFSISSNKLDRHQYKFFMGKENLNRFNKFSLSYGYEFSYGIGIGKNAEYTFGPNSIFSQNNNFITRDYIDRTTAHLLSGIGFIGMKFHVSNNFSVGFESAVGIAYFLTNSKIITGENVKESGYLLDLDPNRYFMIEFSF